MGLIVELMILFVYHDRFPERDFVGNLSCVVSHVCPYNDCFCVGGEEALV